MGLASRAWRRPPEAHVSALALPRAMLCSESTRSTSSAIRARSNPAAGTFCRPAGLASDSTGGAIVAGAATEAAGKAAGTAASAQGLGRRCPSQRPLQPPTGFCAKGAGHALIRRNAAMVHRARFPGDTFDVQQVQRPDVIGGNVPAGRAATQRHRRKKIGGIADRSVHGRSVDANAKCVGDGLAQTANGRVICAE